MKRHVLVVCATLALASGAAHAIPFDRIPLISNTLGDVQNRLCSGAATPVGQADIACPSYSPYLTSGGLLGIGTSTPTTALEVSGTVSATHFVGDGSGLTGVTAAATDRITSGSTQMVVVSNTGYVSLTQAGTNTGWFDPTRGLVTLGVSSTGAISGTNGYFSGNVGMGVTSPLSPLHVSGTLTAIAAGPLSNFNSSYAGHMLYSRPGGGLSYVTTAPSSAFTDDYTILSGLTSRLDTPASSTHSTDNASGLEGIVTNASTAPYNGDGFWGTTGVSGQVYNTGTLSSAVGTRGFVESDAGNVNTASGGSFNANVMGGTVTSTVGVIAVTYVKNTTANTVTGADVRPYAGSSGVITNRMVGVSIYPAILAGSTVANRYGLYIDDGGGTATTNDFGLYQAASYQKNRFAGQVGIGITPTVPLEVSGTISATNLVVNGVSITGGAQADLITSGTSNVTVNSATSTISFTTNGSVANYIDSSGRLVTTGISVTSNQLSATTGYFSRNVGIGTTSPNGLLNVYGAPTATANYGLLSLGNGAWDGASAGKFAGNSNGTVIAANAASGYTGNLMDLQLAGTSQFNVSKNGEISIPFSASTWPLSFASGLNGFKFQASGHGLIITRGDASTIVRMSDTDTRIAGSLYVGAQVGGTAQDDTVLSRLSGGVLEIGSSAANANGTILVGTVGIGTTNPSKTLHVSGTVLTTSWTGINFSSTGNVTPTAPLEVSGTVSATRFVGDGSGLTNLSVQGDHITSGTASVIANHNTGVSVSAPMDVSGGVNVSGSVGIGTNNPQATLDVSGSIKLSGTGTEVCDAAHVYMLVIDPSTSSLLMCRP